jgi:hypothetical protein
MQSVFKGSGQQSCPLPKCLGVFVLASLAALLSSCAKPAAEDPTPPGVAIRHEISPDPPRVGAATLTIKVSDATGVPITKAHIGLEADMQHPGMVPHSYDINELAPGVYQSKLKFDMAGDWIMLLHIRLPDGNTLDRQFEVKGVQPR